MVWQSLYLMLFLWPTAAQKGPMAGMIVLLILMMLSTHSHSTSDGDTLLAMKEKWRGVLPTWVNGTDPCEKWEGVTCNQEGRVYALNLTNKGLEGHIPNEISNLVSLTSLDLSNINGSSKQWNYIKGDLSAVGSLSNLQVLNLSYNVLQVGFPSAVLQLTSLTALILSNAYLNGPFPVGLSKLSKLQYLYLGNSSMTGDLPAELGGLSNLLELSLWNNQFDSEIPVELGNLAHLVYLNLHSCSLWGGLPPGFGNLKSLQKLYLYNNILTGVIPDSWKNMENLTDLRLQYNFLTGSFPSWTFHLTKLQYVELAYNQMYEKFPNLSNSHFQTLRVECNFFTGDWPIKQPNMTLYDEGNCFSNITTDNDDSKYICTRQITCNDFAHQLNGICPACPANQTFLNMNLCTCGEEKNSRSQSAIGMIIGSILAAVFVLLCAYFVLKKWRKSKNNQISRHEDAFSVREHAESWDVPQGVQMFSFQELAKATHNFDRDHEIGVGGFGKVFCGTLNSGKKVAIKRAFMSRMQGSAEFQNEVLLLSRLHHRNLVHLEGFCEENGVQILVYEYVANGNLHTWLGRKGVNRALDWFQRLNIAVGIAQGLEYLHSFADPPVIHRDVKPSNILLDENMVPKLADFGLSRATLESQTHLSTSPAGTAGYIDPQYFLRRQLTTASDVYAFGIVLLELVTGQMAIDHNRFEDNIAAWVKAKLCDIEGMRSIIDPQLGNLYPEQVYWKIIELGISCSSFNKDDRPSIKEVVLILEANIQSIYSPLSKVTHHLDEDTKEQFLNNPSKNSFEHSTEMKSLFSSKSNIETTFSPLDISIIEPH